MSRRFTPPTTAELSHLFPELIVTQLLAKGGMGAVYLAHQLTRGRSVALKILPREFNHDHQSRAAFKREAKALATLDHPNLLRSYDYGERDGLFFIIMQFHPGRSLFAKAHKRSVDMPEAAQLMSEICHALHHAHNAGLIHRDIKPENILLDDNATPTIVDFGLTRPLSNTHDGGLVYGTPGYTAPEVLHNPHGIDQRADIYSAGVMLYELLTGRMPPYPYIPASVISDSHEDFDVIVLKAIHPHRDYRYPNAAEMAAELDELITHLHDPQAREKNFVKTAPQSVQAPKTSPLALTPLGASLQGSNYRTHLTHS